MLVIDGNHFAYRILYASMREMKDTNFEFFRHVFIQSLFATIQKCADSKVVLAVDNRSWRKQVYEQYKAHRAEEREKSPIDFDAFFAFINGFWNEIEENFPIAVVRVKYAEADDVFGALAQNFKSLITENEKITFVSSDKDMFQVKLHCDCVVYDPIKKTEIMKGASKELVETAHRIKIMTGDSGDNIPPVEKGIGEKRAAKIIKLDSAKFEAWLNENNRRENWERNFKLMSFCKIPQVLQTKIIEETKNKLNKVQISITNRDFFQKMIKYYRVNGLIRLIDRVDEHIESFIRFARFQENQMHV